MFKFLKKKPNLITIRAEEVNCGDRILYNGTIVEVDALGSNESMVYLYVIPVDQLPFTSGGIEVRFRRETLMFVTR